MRFRVGAALGFAAGYVLGAKAGRYRYEQITKLAGRIWESEPVDKAREQAGKAMGDAQHKVTDRLRSMADRGNGEHPSPRALTLP